MPTTNRVKRVVDVVASALGLLVLLPVLLVVCTLIWLQDWHGPLYIAPRVGRGGRMFSMVKLRTMVVRADRSGVDSTAKSDPRITGLGALIRRFKLDELTQLWNVLRGDMSIVGPRPQVERDVRLYTAVERHLLDLRPGITDFASIVFADEGSILEGARDPDLRYNQIIRPWKSWLGLHYVKRRTLWLDGRLALATLLQAGSRRRALAWVSTMLQETGADSKLIAVARRDTALVAAPPPGASTVVQSRAPSVVATS
jgi:lipopolysaccharide/colanic/teichoic acid biosynthesis glycosyltransferase